MDEEAFLEEKIGKVARLTVNRPSARYDISLKMIGDPGQAVLCLGAAPDAEAGIGVFIERRAPDWHLQGMG